MRQRWWLPLVILCLGAAVVWPMRDSRTAEAIAARSPRQQWLAAAFLLLLYGLKSLSFAFPLSALEAAGGLLFSFPAALAVNLCGVLLAHSLPFLLGRREREGLAATARRHPRLARLRPDARHPGQTVLLLRLAGAAPGDLVSLWLGAAGVPFRAYVAGDFLGSIPRVAAATLAGSALWDIGTPRFWISLLPGALLTGLSFLLWRFFAAKKPA